MLLRLRARGHIQDRKCLMEEKASAEGHILSWVMKESVCEEFGAWKNPFVSVNLD